MRIFIALALLGAALTASAVNTVTTAPASTGSFVGGIDQNWTVSIDGGASLAVGSPSYGGYFQGAPFTAASAWIGLQGVATSTYTFSTTFTIDAPDVASYGLVGSFSSDNASRIFLNGSDTGVNAPYGSGGNVPGDSYLQAFSLNLNSGFQAGLNTLSFVVTNDGGSNSAPGSWANPDPVGMRAELQAVPEPASIAALGVGAASLLRRRRKA